MACTGIGQFGEEFLHVLRPGIHKISRNMEIARDGLKFVHLPIVEPFLDRIETEANFASVVPFPAMQTNFRGNGNCGGITPASQHHINIFLDNVIGSATGTLLIAIVASSPDAPVDQTLAVRAVRRYQHCRAFLCIVATNAMRGVSTRGTAIYQKTRQWLIIRVVFKYFAAQDT